MDASDPIAADPLGAALGPTVAALLGDLPAASVLLVQPGVAVAAALAGECRRILHTDPATVQGESAPAEAVVCLGALTAAPDATAYHARIGALAALCSDRLLVAGYEDAPAFVAAGTRYHEPLTVSLARAGFDEIIVVGGWRDVVLVQARRPRRAVHARDMAAPAVNLMAHLVDDPLAFARLLDLARATVGFFPAHNPRALEYTWIASRLGGALHGQRMLDVGAGVNPLPLWLARHGAQVTTIDSHPTARLPGERASWNEWGYLDYAQFDARLRSLRLPYEEYVPDACFDVIYSVSVIEHLPAAVRRRWLRSFAAQLSGRGRLLLTVDLVPWSDQLWPFAEGRMVEDAAVHGDLPALLQELEAAGLVVVDGVVRRTVPGSRVALAMLEAKAD